MMINSDLLQLGELTEDILITSLRDRYNQNQIYTSIGEGILISINPFQNLQIYDVNNQSVLVQKAHLFPMSKAALTNLERYNKNQSIVISGESGSGKTEATKIILRFLSSSQNVGGQPQTKGRIEQQVVDNNVILEAFGNAKTARNDNSSRFGKFINLSIGNDSRIHNAQIQSYLLERSRVTSVKGQIERNYHIFYYLIRGSSEEQRSTYYLSGNVQDYEYLKYGDILSELKDKQNFSAVIDSLALMGFSSDEIEKLFSIISAILQLGNMAGGITGDQDAADISANNAYLGYATNLLGLPNTQVLRLAICNPSIIDAYTQQPIQKNQTQQQARQNIESLCKILYGNTFDWIISKVNKALLGDLQSGSKFPRINILDIFGFEIFETNSFEQLCINYANEKLQCAFNDSVFLAEQLEYKTEGVQWVEVNFNKSFQGVSNLIDANNMSIFRLLNDQCIIPNGQDDAFLGQIKKQFNQQTSLITCTNSSFVISHFAGKVEYKITGFVDKNKDAPNRTILELLQESQNYIIQQSLLLQTTGNTSQNLTTNASIKGSVSKKFQAQLQQLQGELDISTNFYVRCIKPNALKQPNSFDIEQVRRQVECAGLMETVKIRREGYSLRQMQSEFIDRYGQLIGISKDNQKKLDGTQIKESCRQIVEKNQMISSSSPSHSSKTNNRYFFVGRTKVFFSNDCRDELERRLAELKKIQLTIFLQRQIRYKQFRKRMQEEIIQRLQREAFHREEMVKKIQQYVRYLQFRKRMQEAIKSRLEKEKELRLRRENEERLRREQEERLRQENEEKMRKKQEEDDRLIKEYQDKLTYEEQELLTQQEEAKKRRILEESMALVGEIKRRRELEKSQSPSPQSFEHNRNQSFGSPQANNVNSDNNNNFQTFAVQPMTQNSFMQQIESQMRQQAPQEIFLSSSPSQNMIYLNNNNSPRQNEQQQYKTVPYSPNHQEQFKSSYYQIQQQQKEQYDQQEQQQKQRQQQEQYNYAQNSFNGNGLISANNPQGYVSTNMNVLHDASEILPTSILSSQKENEIMEILRQKSRLLSLPQELASFSLTNYLDLTSNVGEFLQLIQTQIMSQGKDILQLTEKANQSEIIQEGLQKQLDDKIKTYAIQTKNLQDQINSMNSQYYEQKQGFENQYGSQMNGNVSKVISNGDDSNKNNNNSIEMRQFEKRISDLEEELRQMNLEKQAIMLLNDEQRKDLTMKQQESLKKQSKVNEFERQIDKLKQKDAYNEKVIMEIFYLLRCKEEELQALRKAFKDKEQLLPQPEGMDAIIQKQDQSLARLHSLYKPNGGIQQN